MPDYDVVIIGAGHNALTCAGYLAKAGLSVKMFERRDVVGGAAVTEEFHPGFRNSVYSYSISLLHPKVIQDLQLAQHGLEIMERPAGTLSLLQDDHLLLSRDANQAREEIARFCPSDADKIDAFEDEIEAVAMALREIALASPPNIGGGWADLISAVKAGNTLRKLNPKHQLILAELMTKSLGDYLDSWFDGEALKGILGLEGVIGNFADPYQQGTAYVLLHHAFGEVNGRPGAWGIARGGMGSITQAMASFARSKGVEIETGVGIEQLLMSGDKVEGVITDDGRTVTADAVAAGIHPQTLLLQLGQPDLIPDRDRQRIEHYRSHSATFRMNVALSELPKFTSIKTDTDTHFAGAIEICPSLPYLTQAYNDACTDGWSKQPVISMQVPTTQDDSLAPPGGHVASLFCQHFQRELPDGRSWDDVRETVADAVIATVDQYAPNFAAAVVGRQIKTPLDIERDLGMVGGDIFHGTLHLDQLYSMRPIGRYGNYRMPYKNLYLCGSGAHPGGGVSGLPGHNAAKIILKDR